MSVASLLTIPITWKQSVFQWVNGQRKYGYIYKKKRILLSHEKKKQSATCLNKNGTWKKYGKWSNSEKDKYCLILFKYEI